MSMVQTVRRAIRRGRLGLGGPHSHYVGEVERLLRHVREQRVQRLPRRRAAQRLTEGAGKLLGRRFLRGSTTHIDGDANVFTVRNLTHFNTRNNNYTVTTK